MRMPSSPPVPLFGGFRVSVLPDRNSALRWCGVLLLLIAAAGLSGCSGAGLIGSREAAQVRLIQASPDVPALDLYLNDSAVAYNLAFGMRTSYVPVGAGTYQVHADSTGTRQALAGLNSTVIAGRQYTAIIGDTAANLHLLLLPDQTHPARNGEAALRVVNQITRGGPVDVYLTPSGANLVPAAPFAAAMSFGGVEGYRAVPAGSYAIAAFAAGTTPGAGYPPLFAGPLMGLRSGAVRTVVLLDRPGIAPGVQAIVNVEGEPVYGN